MSETTETTKYVVDSMGKGLTESAKYLDKHLTDIVNYLNQNLGEVSKHVYGVLVRQQVIDGITSLLCVGLAAIIIFFCILGLRELNKMNSEEAGFMTGLVVLIIAFLIYIFVTLPGGIGHIVNPEYYAIQEILENIG